MVDYEIHNVTVMDIPGTDNSLHPTITKRVIFYVGGSGPFQLNYSQAQYKSANVLADMRAQVQILRDIGAKPQAGA